MSIDNPHVNALKNEKLLEIAGYLLAALMMACAAMTAVIFFSHLMPGWYPWHLVAIAFLVALDRLFTYKRFKNYVVFSSEWLGSIVVQWLVIIVVVKVADSLSSGWNVLLSEMALWQQDFLAYFLNVHFAASALVVFAVWFAAGTIASLLDELGIEQTAILNEIASASQSQEPPAFQRLLNFIVTIGVILIVLTALSRIDLRALTFSNMDYLMTELPPLAGAGASTLLYFMLSLALLSQGQLFSLNTRWSLQNLPVSSGLVKRWALYSLLFLLLLAVLVSFLPTSYSLGLLSALSLVIQTLYWLFLNILQLFVMLVFFLVSLPFIFLGEQAPIENIEIIPPPQEPYLPAIQDVITLSPSWFDAVKEVLFWVVLLVFTIAVMVQYFRQHEGMLAVAKKVPGWHLLAQLWQWLTHFWQGLKTEAVRVIEQRRERLKTRRSAQAAAQKPRLLGSWRLSPRQKIYFFYLALVRRGSEAGISRRSSQTPVEYAAELEKSLPGVEEDIDSMTQAFMEARYSQHPVAPDDVGIFKKHWEKVRSLLRPR